MSKITRRRFLAGAAAAAGAVTLARPGLLAAEPAVSSIKSGAEIVTLGKSGIKTSVLGIGTGTFGGREQRNMGKEAFSRLVRHAYSLGVRYIDTADGYKTHDYVREAIAGLPRSELFIQTKTRAKDARTARDDIERFRRELGVEQLDTVLMHCMTKSSWPVDMRPVMDVLAEAKQKGRVRAVGVSCHGWDPLVASADLDEWLDVHLVRINPQGKMMDAEPEKVAAQIEKMAAKQRGVLGMKIYGEGAFKTREERLASLKYVLGLGAVHAFTIGFSDTRQIDETLELIRQALA